MKRHTDMIFGLLGITFLVLVLIIGNIFYRANQPQPGDIWTYCDSSNKNPFEESVACDHLRVLDVKEGYVQYEPIPNFNGKSGYKSASISWFKIGSRKLEVAD